MKNIIIIIFLFVSNILFSQHICGTSHTVNSELEKLINKKRMSYRGDISKKSFCINIHFKIVRNSQGVGGIDPNTLQRIIEELNIYFNPQNIYFNSIGFEYIDNSRYVNVASYNEASTLLKISNRDNAINYYIVDTLWGAVAGRAFDIPSNSLVMNKSYLLSSISAHEVGHCLGLYHTFETYFCKENINGSNCHNCGDKVCDTPADENNYNNNGYNPDLRNIMSYYPMTDRFTQGQFNRMKHYILHTSLLQKVVSNNCPYILEIQGKKAVCNTPQTYTANNPNGDAIQWELPDSVEKISETANSITIKAKQGYGGWATLKAINGTTETTKQIWVGKAPLSFELYTIDDERYAGYKLVSNEPALSLEDFGIDHNSLTCEYTLVPNFDAVLYSGNCIGGSIQAHPNNTTDPMVGLSIEIKNKPNEECIDVNWAASMMVKNYNIPNNLHLYSVSPNPARDVVHISLSNLATTQNKMKTTTSLTQKLNTPTYGELFDYMGKKVAQVQITNGKAQLNVNGLKGTYILKISTNGHTEQHKIIVK